ncbi:glycosyltransferase family 39 protein [Sansalvadorimonas verongulae]|uniref:glycosyltransferase family 39 protein n=1 Tax=Sansalvadorimonas verongulae TaxID=2172824 RepID=UPI0012BD0E57|nr:glycosyltransferase family 39 protein [Sansalvadorimonas verongulae]MTI15183.1 glycosyltransferase family 39 protein [Sansalvadorimonas verongulae]
MQQQGRLHALGIIIGVLFIHLVMASGVPLGVDEAHYALYALHPALSYFDHPPMVGWLQMLIAPLGYDEFTVRLIPALLYALSSYLAFRVSYRLFPEGPAYVGLLSVLLINSAPIFQLMGWGLVPDLPLMALGLLSLELILSIHKYNQHKHWIALGVVYGLAGLSKYTAVFLPAGMIIFMIQYNGLKWLKGRGPWLAALIALIIISPVLIWNAQNDWASLAYQFDRGVGVKSWAARKVVAMQLAQVVLYSVLAYVAAIAAIVAVLRKNIPEQDRASCWLIIWSALPLLLVVGWSAGDGTFLPNWPALGWTLLAPLSSYWICRGWHKLWVKSLVVVSSVLSLALISFLFIFLAFMPLSTFPFMSPLIKDLVGWNEAAKHAVALKQEWRKEEGRDPVLLIDNWSKASRIAWYAYPEPVQLVTDRLTQFDFWHGKPGPDTYGILIRDKKSAPESGHLTLKGFSCSLFDQTEATLDRIVINRFQFYRCEPAH